MKTAIYPGTFDPITNGHMDLVKRSLDIFEKVIVAIGINPNKTPLFSVDERKSLVMESLAGLEGVEVDCFDELLIDYAKKKNASAIIRGLRAISDFEYEFQIALMNRRLEPALETVFLLPSEEYVYLTSSIIREVSRYKGDVEAFVPPVVLKKLKERFGK